MIFFLGYAVSLVILEGFLGNGIAIEMWAGIIAGIFAVAILFAIWISLQFLVKTWQESINPLGKLLIGIFSFIAALFTVFLFAVYLARLT